MKTVKDWVIMISMVITIFAFGASVRDEDSKDAEIRLLRATVAMQERQIEKLGKDIENLKAQLAAASGQATSKPDSPLATLRASIMPPTKPLLKTDNKPVKKTYNLSSIFSAMHRKHPETPQPTLELQLMNLLKGAGTSDAEITFSNGQMIVIHTQAGHNQIVQLLIKIQTNPP